MRLGPFVGWCVLTASVTSLLPLKLEVIRVMFPVLIIMSLGSLTASSRKNVLWVLGPLFMAALLVALIGLPGIPSHQARTYGLLAIAVWVMLGSIVVSLKLRYDQS